MLIRSKHEGYWGDGIRLYLGGGGNSTPPPDPRLVDAQINSLNIQADAAKSIMANANALAPLQQQQMQFGLMAARTAYADSREDRRYMLERRGQLTTQQNRMIKEANEFNLPGRQEELASKAMADVETAAASADQDRVRSLTRMGVNPNSTRFGVDANAASLAKAGIKAASGNDAREAARWEGRALTDRAANSLSGYPAMAMQTTQNSLTNGTAGVTVVNQGVAGMNSSYSAAAGAASGSGSTAAQLYGTQAGIYNNARNAAAQEEAGMWGAVGTGVGIYASIAI